MLNYHVVLDIWSDDTPPVKLRTEQLVLVALTQAGAEAWANALASEVYDEVMNDTNVDSVSVRTVQPIGSSLI